MGSLIVFGTPEEWERLRLGLDDLFSELKHDVVPSAEASEFDGVIVDLKEAMTIVAVMEDEELTRSFFQFMFEAKR